MVSSYNQTWYCRQWHKKRVQFRSSFCSYVFLISSQYTLVLPGLRHSGSLALNTPAPTNKCRSVILDWTRRGVLNGYQSWEPTLSLSKKVLSRTISAGPSVNFVFIHESWWWSCLGTTETNRGLKVQLGQSAAKVFELWLSFTYDPESRPSSSQECVFQTVW